MKIQVKDEQGIDEAGNKYPAPGIKDGTHECELKWQFDSVTGWVTAADCYYQIYHNNFEEFSKSHRETRQAWVLAEQDKEGTSVKDTVIAKFTGTGVSASIREMYLSGAEFGYSQAHIRIAELEARVAELEGALKDIKEAYNRYVYPPLK